MNRPMDDDIPTDRVVILSEMMFDPDDERFKALMRAYLRTFSRRSQRLVDININKALAALEFDPVIPCRDHVRYCDGTSHDAQWLINMVCGCLIPCCDTALTARRYEFLYSIHRCVQCENKSTVKSIERL